MALTFNWNWRAPQVRVPEGSAFKTSGTAQAFDDIASSIAGARERQYRQEQDRLNRERQSRLDNQAAWDRERRIAEEDRKIAEEKRKIESYKKIGDAISGLSGVDVDALKLEREQLMKELKELGG